MDSMNMDRVRNILQQHFPKTKWNISLPDDGQHRASYIAKSKEIQVFIKFDVPIDAIQRLGEIKVAPRIVASGLYEGSTYMVQEYITGRYPDWRWFANHLPYLAAFIRRYHSDHQLTSILAQTMTTHCDDHIALDLATLETQFTSLNVDGLHAPEIVSAFDELKNQAHTLRSDKLVPVHPDPNTKNMLLVDTRLLMVDWDDLQLSDPMRDAGLLLWWYVSPIKWPIFFQAYGLVLDENLVDRIYWWAARSSFAIALWHVEHEFDCTAFLQDFIAALNKCNNPRAVFQES
jgi:aminoglycoside phosphotransferase (APT) family kinase protein